MIESAATKPCLFTIGHSDHELPEFKLDGSALEPYSKPSAGPAATAEPPDPQKPQEGE